MGITGPVHPVTAEEPAGPHSAGHGSAQPAGRRTAESLAALAGAAGRAPFTARARRDLLFCLIEAPLGFGVFVFPVLLVGLLLAIGLLTQGSGPSTSASRTHPAGVLPVVLGGFVILLALVILLPAASRWFSAVQRRLAAGVLGEPVAAPPPVRAARGVRRLDATLRDGPGWRAAAYPLVKLPVWVIEIYAVFLAVAGLAGLSYPFWWPLFRNHGPGVQLQPVPVFTPFGAFHVATFPGTLAAFAAGAAMVLAAPWLARAGAAADVWLMRGMLGPGRLARRVADLEQSRALAVEDSAALLRRLERDLHDGAQIRLATLAMNLGLAREKLPADADPEVRELVDAAHQGAKDALVELRNLARGLHPPALDHGLADALATLAASSAVPVALTTALPRRPAPAIETIAYFCAAELLANAAKHSHANQVTVDVTEPGPALVLRVSDDGAGGADPARGSGLSGLAQRARTVDGRVGIVSPAGGPTQVTVTLPMHA